MALVRSAEYRIKLKSLVFIFTMAMLMMTGAPQAVSGTYILPNDLSSTERLHAKKFLNGQHKRVSNTLFFEKLYKT